MGNVEGEAEDDDEDEDEDDDDDDDDVEDEDGGEDEVEDDDVEEDVGKGEEDDLVENDRWCWRGGPIPRPGPARGASLRNWNALAHFTRSMLRKNLQVKCRGPAGAQDCSPHLVRACAIVRRLEISSGPIGTETSRKNAGAQTRDPDLVRAYAVQVHLGISRESPSTEI